ncbi:MAG: GTP cyclohydrolase II, partial [Alphaproteobacteria bacterium]|nr:GTP cyclohydrolase II [Alphaproteobacteria bacterium]
ATLGVLRAAGRGTLHLAMSRFRAGALGLEAEQETVLAALSNDVTLDEIVGAAEPAARAVSGSVARGAAPTEDRPIVAALSLAKLSGLMPMIVVARDAMPRGDVPAVSIEDVEGFAEASARWLTQVADARVPLAEAEEARLIAFRPWGGGPEHLAIVIGTPDASRPVLTRIHSSCFTGDLLGSLRCDCGDQLRGAIRAIAAEGAGIVVYLPQEGRGIGLVNKLRAYALQDAGFDTIDANTHLGFAPDERSYAAAGEILRRLGISRIRLLTNNPGKGEALAGFGVDVVERVKLAFPSNPYNAAYLRTKAVRDGHNF